MPKKTKGKRKSKKTAQISQTNKQGVNIKIDLSKRSKNKQTPTTQRIPQPTGIPVPSIQFLPSFQQPQYVSEMIKPSVPVINPVQVPNDPFRPDSLYEEARFKAMNEPADTIYPEEAFYPDADDEFSNEGNSKSVLSTVSSEYLPREKSRLPKYANQASEAKEFIKRSNPEGYKEDDFYRTLKRYVQRAPGAKLTSEDKQRLNNILSQIKA